MILSRLHIMELLLFGSNANNLAQCGVAYSNSNNTFSNSNTNIGARLKIFTTFFCKDGEWKHKPSLHMIAPVSMEDNSQTTASDRAKIKDVGYEGKALSQTQQSPLAQVSYTVVGICRKPVSRMMKNAITSNVSKYDCICYCEA